ncbi:hypothetical protein BDN71DRAFT_1433386 [Pleurotus eryngii]|uniref:Uncharacterized protein n=1 Tax=Pleurotus eryngii TaxID=5323 RepID=A0A9P5ZQM4_PLEER|nr:hypothetical protein BDN71DRAFT_1433386 [Pleurotus eryngii]
MLNYIVKHNISLTSTVAGKCYLPAHTQGLVFVTDGCNMATCYRDMIRIIDCASGREICNLPLIGNEATAVTWAAPDLFLSGWTNRSLMFQWAKAWELKVLNETITYPALHLDNLWLAIAGQSCVDVWLSEGKELNSDSVDRAHAHDKDTKFKVLHLFTKVPVPIHCDDTSPVQITSLSWLGIMTTLVVSYLHHGIIRWDVNTQSTVFAHTMPNLPHVSHQQTFDHAEANCQEEWNPAIFIYNGCALLKGRRGCAIIWDISTVTPLTPDIPLEDDVFLIAITRKEWLLVLETRRVGKTLDPVQVSKSLAKVVALVMLFVLRVIVTVANHGR